MPRGGRDEVLDRQAEHLRERTERRLTGIGLPVRIRDEARSGVEGEVGSHRPETSRVQRQISLQSLQRIERDQPRDIEQQHGHGIGLPPTKTFLNLSSQTAHLTVVI